MPDDQPSYQREPYRRTLEVEVLEVGEDERGVWAVLDDTVLYPEGGGQPADRGLLAGVPVHDVRRRGERLEHWLERPVEPGEARLELDWARRYDHMQQHTAQHLLSAIAQDRHGWATSSFHLGVLDQGAGVCDIELDVAELSVLQLARLEEELAEEIRAARAVTARHLERDELEALGERVRSRGLPEGFSGAVRLVEIAGVDLNTCGGTHLGSTAEIEAIKLLGTERMRGGTRLYWVAGARVRARLGRDEERLAALRGIFECADDELEEIADKKLVRLEAAERRVRDLQRALAERTAGVLAAFSDRVVEAHFADEDAAFLQAIGRAFAASDHPGMALLTAGEGEKASFLVAAGGGSGREAIEVGPAVAEALGGRGGGRGAIFQGRAGSLEGRAEALARMQAALP
ncbi:MAG TPA: alanyl-tRNA editing protein [Thermoanaerobaculia bacterium]|nr:alanyl-tRNA editing protein [Thermoanaerobaculia bacterium]